ncbi:MAG TPA: thioredoxin family protein [Candidatus Nanoarchaeia archaeon]|nr:thioredoxin family protein [Candidatus Nanoarchaeia archaeon]
MNKHLNMERYKIKKKSLKALAIWIILIAAFFLLFPIIRLISPLQSVNQNAETCPDTVLGDEDTNFQIKYFYSADCVYCLGEERVINDLVKEKGYLFSIEKYDINICSDAANTFGVIKTPSFVFFDKKENSYFTKDSYLPKDALERTICKSTGSCF